MVVVGAAVFVCVAFAPASFVFGIADAVRRRQFLEDHARSWRWCQLPFAAGAVVSAVGLVLLGAQLDGWRQLVVLVAGALATAASVPWAEHCRLRALSPDDFLEGRLPGWHFQVYVWGTLAALAVTGLALLGTDTPTWAAWGSAGSAVVLAAAFLGFGDLPPFLLYVVTGALGLALL